MRRVEKLVVEEFEWNPSKAQANFEKHGISFDEAAESLSHPHLEVQSDRDGENRVLAICPLSIRIIAVVYTLRDDKCRIISARAARDYEQREYRDVYPG